MNRLTLAIGLALSAGSLRAAETPKAADAPSPAPAASASIYTYDPLKVIGQRLFPYQEGMSAALRALRRDPDYRRAYAEAFGSPGVDMIRTGQALATFQRSLVPRFNRFDRFLEGRRELLDDRQLWGLHLFRTRARCMNCHSGASLSDQGFHNLGLHFYGRKLQDLGRYEVTGDPLDAGKFKTPSLRNVAKTGPWMHNGRFATLRGVLNLYNAGMPRPQPNAQQLGDPLFPQPDPLLHPLDLHRTELEALAAFLETL